MAYEKEMTVGAAIARKAGELALKIREGNIGVEIKADESPVTIADKACEKLIVEELSAAFPGDGFLGEEGSSEESKNGRRWIIDPIDGTRDFIRGTRAWSVLIGLEERGQVVAGHAYFPALDEMFSAAKGEGAYWDAKAIDSKLTSMGKDLRAQNASPYVSAGDVKFTQEAFDKVVTYKGSTKNHLWSQVLSFELGSGDKQPKDCLDTFTYGCAIGIGGRGGF